MKQYTMHPSLDFHTRKIDQVFLVARLQACWRRCLAHENLGSSLGVGTTFTVFALESWGTVCRIVCQLFMFHKYYINSLCFDDITLYLICLSMVLCPVFRVVLNWLLTHHITEPSNRCQIVNVFNDFNDTWARINYVTKK